MRKLIPLIVLALLSGCAPMVVSTEEPTPRLSSPVPEQELAPIQTERVDFVALELAVRDLALRLSVEMREIEVISIESVDWADSSLGCPMPGVDYSQVITPGYRITLGVGGQVYTYHTNTAQTLVLCQDGEPQLPPIPVIPGEIQDGEPWMPVDPVPTVAEGEAIVDPDPVR